MIVGIIFIILGLFFIYLGGTLLLFVLKVSKWPQTHGSLIEKHLGDPKQVSGDSFTNQRVFVNYKYEVRGKQHSSNKLYSLELLRGERTDLKAKAKKILDSISETVIVYYNPSKPEESFLLTDNPAMGIILLILGISCLIAGMVSLFI